MREQRERGLFYQLATTKDEEEIVSLSAHGLDIVQPKDIGQMNMYLGYFALDVNTESDNPPIGIILAADKNDVMVQYATYNMDANLFVAKYQLYLPETEELKQIVRAELDKYNQ